MGTNSKVIQQKKQGEGISHDVRIVPCHLDVSPQIGGRNFLYEGTYNNN